MGQVVGTIEPRQVIQWRTPQFRDIYLFILVLCGEVQQLREHCQGRD